MLFKPLVWALLCSCVVNVEGFNFDYFTEISVPFVSKPNNQATNEYAGKGLLHELADRYKLSQDVLASPELVSMYDDMALKLGKDGLVKEIEKLEGQYSISSPLNKVKSFYNSEKWEFIESSKSEGYQLRMKEVSFPEFLNIDKVKQYSGYLDVEEEDKHFFYWFFESRNDPVNDPIILWLNGGPGCSSMTGLFFELGPSSIGPDLKPIYNEFSWNSNASVIFLDEPVNVGFSYSSRNVFSSDSAAVDVYAFMELFFLKFPHLRANDFHISGESYLGHYLPSIGHEFLKHEDRTFNFKSVLIGNGITDSYAQSPSYETMACGQGGYPAVISEDQCDELASKMPRCQRLISICYEYENPVTCVAASVICADLMSPYQATGLNPYDIRVPCGDSELCYDEMSYVEEFLNMPIVQELIGAEVENFTSCQNTVGVQFALYGDLSRPKQQYVAELLEAKIPVLIYAGDKDYICNWLGNHYWTESLEWEGMYGFQASQMQNWTTLSGVNAGEVKSFGNFTFLRVFDAGHMVPFNQPENSLDMVNRWISGDYTYGY